MLIWKRNFPDINTSPIEDVLNNSTSLLSGTGWGDSEYLVRLEAKKRSIKNIAVIDHWTNYEKRFSRNDNEELPDLILVSDKYAFDKAKNLLRNSSLSIAEISHMTGFYSSSHFSSLFMNYFDISPTEYKKSSQISYINRIR